MQVILGARTSMEIGVGAALLATILGVLIGAVSGYFGGIVDAVMMRTTDVFLCLPFLPLLLLLSKYIGGGGVTFIILIFGVLGWPRRSRTDSELLPDLSGADLVDAARAVGDSPARIIFRHIMPNSLSPVIVSFTLAVAAFIGAEAAIDFLGLGLRPPAVAGAWPSRRPNSRC